MRASALLPALALLAACTVESRPPAADSGTRDAGMASATPDSAVEAQMAPVWKAAADSGYTFRAIGQEPGWILTIHPRRGIRYIGSYGDVRLDAPSTAPVTDGRGAQTWLATTDSGTLAITAERKSCADAMSGARMSYTVSVTVGGRTVHGCGNELTASPSAAPHPAAP